jgi:hypothetical protein
LGDSAVSARAKQLAERFADNRGIERAADLIEALRKSPQAEPAMATV